MDGCGINDEMIANFGALGYDAERCANVAGVDAEFIFSAMQDPESDFSKMYRKGQHRAEYVIDLKLFEMAQTGDIKAIDKLEQRRAARERLNAKKSKP